MSSVFKAHDRLLDRHVALKVLHQHFTEDEEYLERFRREARLVAQLSHPGIVTVIDRGEADGRQFIVFEFVDGENLKELVVREGPLSVDDSLDLAAAIARALGFAHGEGLVHRDVKPQNVLLNGDGVPKVTDFGIARSLEIEHGVTQTGTVLGTSNYIAPEQASGERVSAQTDVYSLGVVLFELLTGEVPFEGENFVAVALKHINEAPPSVLDRRGNVPPRVAAAVDRALAKEPRRRFPSMDAFAAELEAARAELRAGDDPGATMVVTPRPPARGTRTHSPFPLLIGLLALLALGVIAAAAIAIHNGHGFGIVSAGPSKSKSGPVTLSAAGSFDPAGDGSEHAGDVPKAVDGNAATAWTTEHYRSFTKPGVGLILAAPDAVTLRSLTIQSDTPGYTAQIESGDSASGGFAPVSSSQTVGASTTFTLKGKSARYYLVWITKLPPGSDHSRVNEVSAST